MFELARAVRDRLAVVFRRTPPAVRQIAVRSWENCIFGVVLLVWTACLIGRVLAAILEE